MDICTATKLRKLCTEKKNNHRITFDYPLPIPGSELERAWKRGYDMKTRENAIENVFLDIWKSIAVPLILLSSLVAEP